MKKVFCYLLCSFVFYQNNINPESNKKHMLKLSLYAIITSIAFKSFKDRNDTNQSLFSLESWIKCYNNNKAFFLINLLFFVILIIKKNIMHKYSKKSEINANESRMHQLQKALQEVSRNMPPAKLTFTLKGLFYRIQKWEIQLDINYEKSALEKDPRAINKIDSDIIYLNNLILYFYSIFIDAAIMKMKQETEKSFYLNQKKYATKLK